jgi:hypothetical protein
VVGAEVVEAAEVQLRRRLTVTLPRQLQPLRAERAVVAVVADAVGILLRPTLIPQLQPTVLWHLLFQPPQEPQPEDVVAEVVPLQ